MMLQHLPDEIILEILTRLSFEYVLQCKEVCKTWRKILSHIKRDPKVNLLIAIKHKSSNLYGRQLDDVMQLYHGEYDEKSNKKLGEQLSYDALTPLGYPCINCAIRPMVGSHMGLVCFHETHDNVNDPIYICNPFTRETVRLPQIDVTKDTKKSFLVSGFGYLYSTNEYKIVRIYYEDKNRAEKKEDCEFLAGQVQVYTLGDRSGWRNKAITINILSNESNGVLSDGALHWVDNTGLEIVAFDLADEEFRAIPPPPCFPVKGYNYYWLLQFGGYLSVVVRRFNDGTNIWSLKETKNRSGRKHWSKEFTITSKDFSPPIYNPFALTQENKILMLARKTTLCHYDPKTATLEEFVDDDDKRFQEFQAVPYMKSDVWLTVLEPDLPVVDWDQLSTRLDDNSFYDNDLH